MATDIDGKSKQNPRFLYSPLLLKKMNLAYDLVRLGLKPRLQRLLARAEKYDVIICTKMDRQGRNTADMIRVVDSCYKKGIAIRFLENGLSTKGTMGKTVIQILAAVAEAERERILERTNDGRIAALAAGVKFGRKKHPRTPTALELISQGESLGSVTEKTGISRSTYFRLKRTIKNDAKIATFSK